MSNAVTRRQDDNACIEPFAAKRFQNIQPLAVGETKIDDGGFKGTLIYQVASATEPLPAPHMALDQLDGPPVILSQVRDKPTVINIWATWCPPCRREMPALAQVEKANPDVRFLFINQGEGGKKIRDYLEMEGIALKHILLDPDMDVPKYYRTVGLPVTLFLNADGTLRYAHVGEIAPEQIVRQIDRLN